MARHLRQTVTFISFFLIITICLPTHFANGKKQYSPTFDNHDKLVQEFKDFFEIKKLSEKYHHHQEDLKEENQGSNDELLQEFKEFFEIKKLSKEFYNQENSNEQEFDNIQDDSSINYLSISRENDEKMPPTDHPALVGRYVVNQVNWTSVATISRQKQITTFPFANVVAFSDGPLGNGSGVPYMFLTPLDFTSKDLSADSRATLMMTLAQSSYCEEKAMEPIDPRCARIILSGKIKRIQPNNFEYDVAKKAVFGRHPKLQYMPADHQFYFAKLEIVFIAVLDNFGGAKFITVADYFNPPQSLKSFRYNLEKNNVEMSPMSPEVNVI